MIRSVSNYLANQPHCSPGIHTTMSAVRKIIGQLNISEDDISTVRTEFICDAAIWAAHNGKKPIQTFNRMLQEGIEQEYEQVAACMARQIINNVTASWYMAAKQDAGGKLEYSSPETYIRHVAVSPEERGMLENAIYRYFLSENKIN